MRRAERRARRAGALLGVGGHQSAKMRRIDEWRGHLVIPGLWGAYVAIVNARVVREMDENGTPWPSRLVQPTEEQMGAFRAAAVRAALQTPPWILVDQDGLLASEPWSPLRTYLWSGLTAAIWLATLAIRAAVGYEAWPTLMVIAAMLTFAFLFLATVEWVSSPWPYPRWDEVEPSRVESDDTHTQ